MTPADPIVMYDTVMIFLRGSGMLANVALTWVASSMLGSDDNETANGLMITCGGGGMILYGESSLQAASIEIVQYGCPAQPTGTWLGLLSFRRESYE